MADNRPTFESLSSLPTAAPEAGAPTAAPKVDKARAAEDAMPGVLGAVTRGMRSVSEASKTAADTILPIPRTVPEAAMAVGSMLAGPAKLLPLIAKLPMPLLRIILGTVGAGTASSAQGAGFAEGAGPAAVASTAGEALGGVVRGGSKVVGALKNKLAPSVGAEGVAADLGKFAGQKSPPLTGISNSGQLEEMALGRGTKPKLGEYFENRLTEAEGLIGPTTTLRVPALMPKEIMTQYGPMPAAKLQGGDRISLRDASEKLAELRLQAYGGAKTDPTGRGINGAEARKQYGDALKQIDSELMSFNPDAAAAWNDGRHAYAVGTALQDVLKRSGIGKGEPLDIAKLREVVSRQRGQLSERMGRDDFKALVDLVFHGGPTQTKTPNFRVALPERVDYPVDLPQIMINASVNRMLPQSSK